jgi:hypothetical protein
VWRFTGLANYYRLLVEGYAEIMPAPASVQALHSSMADLKWFIAI